MLGMKTNINFDKLHTIFSDPAILEKRWKDSLAINDGISKYYNNVSVKKVKENIIIVDFDSYNYDLEICFKREFLSNKALMKHNLIGTGSGKFLGYLLVAFGLIFYNFIDSDLTLNQWLYSITPKDFLVLGLGAGFLVLAEFLAYEFYYKKIILKIISQLSSID